jgi:hypothetical protein
MVNVKGQREDVVTVRADHVLQVLGRRVSVAPESLSEGVNQASDVDVHVGLMRADDAREEGASGPVRSQYEFVEP